MLGYMEKKTKEVDGNKVANELTLKQDDYPGLVQYVITSVLTSGRGIQTSQYQSEGV